MQNRVHELNYKPYNCVSFDKLNAVKLLRFQWQTEGIF